MPAIRSRREDPATACAVLALLEQEREVRDERRRRSRRGDEDAPRAGSRASSQSASAATGRPRSSASRGERRDAAQAASRPAAAAERRAEGEHRARAEQREQRVRAGLLRVPDEERVDSDERRGDETGARARRAPRPRRRRPGSSPCPRAPRASAGRPRRARRALPRPRRRRSTRTASPRARDLGEHVAEATIEERDRDELVQPEALRVERREPQDAADEGDGSDREQRGAEAHQRRCRAPRARSPASAPSAVTMNNG